MAVLVKERVEAPLTVSCFECGQDARLNQYSDDITVAGHSVHVDGLPVYRCQAGHENHLLVWSAALERLFAKAAKRIDLNKVEHVRLVTTIDGGKAVREVELLRAA